MARLGYDRYFAQGGDWGSAVTRRRRSGPRALRSDPSSRWRWRSGRRTRRPTPEEQRALERLEYYRNWDRATRSSSTRPQTLGYGLADSPAGQAAWILEKFWAWTDCDGHPENVLTRDEMLDNMMLYWVTDGATRSARIYWESFGSASARMSRCRPGTVYPKEIVPPVRKWVESRLPERRALGRAAKGRALRRLRAARDCSSTTSASASASSANQ